MFCLGYPILRYPTLGMMNAAFYSLQARCTLLTWTLFFLFVFSFAETGQALVSSVDKIIFVGSPGVGKMVYLSSKVVFA